MQHIPLWCNGNTDVFGASFLGSSPSGGSREEDKYLVRHNLRIFIWSLPVLLFYSIMVVQVPLEHLVEVRILVEQLWPWQNGFMHLIVDQVYMGSNPIGHPNAPLV